MHDGHVGQCLGNKMLYVYGKMEILLVEVNRSRFGEGISTRDMQPLPFDKPSVYRCPTSVIGKHQKSFVQFTFKIYQ